ncbi:MAG: tetratricopeptide repeat protein [Pirellulales bacterium]|nr:tetratricopeptide repeat protein [Pirellulales bacterium]
MAISTTRYLVRGLLVAMILIVAGLLGLNMLRDQPSFDKNKADAAREAGDYPTAIVHLRRLLQKEPNNAQARVMIAELLVEEAKKQNPRASFASERPAMEELIRAADLAPDNLDIQRLLMHAFVDYGGEAEPVAIRTATIVSRLDPNDATAQFVLARQAHQAGQLEEALSRLDKVSELEKTPSLATLMLKAQIVDGLKDPKRTNELVEQAVSLTSNLTDEQLQGMTGPQQEQLMRLLAAGVEMAPGVEAGQVRLGVALDVLERLLKLVGNEPRMIGLISDTAARAHIAILPNFSTPTDSEEERERRAAIAARVETLAKKAIAAQTATPRIYWALARSAFAAGNDDAGFRYLDQGIVRASESSTEMSDQVLRLHHLYCTELMRAGKFRLTEPHVKVLKASTNKNYQGWAHLVAGLVAMVDGNREKSIEEISQARQLMGDTFLVNVTMAENLLRLGMKEDALEYLDRLHPQIADLTVNDAEKIAGGFLSSAPQIHLAQARTLIDLNRYEAAEVHLQAIEVDRELAPRARELRVQYLWASGQRDEALRRLAAARTDFPHDLGLLLAQVTAYWELDQKDQADELLRNFVDEHPENLEAHHQFVTYLLREGRRDEVDEFLVKMEERFPDKPVVLLIKSQIHMSDNEWEKANALAAKIAKLPGGKGISLAIRAQIALHTENYEEAARLFAQMDADGRNGSSLRFMKSLAEARMGNVSQAIDTLAGVLGVSSMRQQAQRLLEGALDELIRREGPEAAELKVDKLLEANPQDPYLLFQRWNIALRLKKYDVAKSTLDRLIAIQPKAKTANDFMRVRTHLAEGRPDLAMEVIEESLPVSALGQAQAEQLGLIVEGAEAAEAMGQYQKALDYSRAALKLNNQYWDAYLTQASALRGLGQHDQAIEVAKRLVEAQPGMYRAHEQLFREYYEAGRLDEALAAARAGRKRFEGATELKQFRDLMQRWEILSLCRLDRRSELNEMEPNNKPLSLVKASAWVELREFDKAIDELNRILKIDPLFTDARVMAAKLCFMQDRYDEAAGHAIAAIGQNRELWELYPLQATAQFRLEQYDSAFGVLRTLIREQPKNATGYRELARLLQSHNDIDEALTVLADGREEMPEELSLARLQIEILAKSKRIPEAQKIIQEIAGENPSPEVCLVVSGIFFQAGAANEAAVWVNQARTNGGDPIECARRLGEIQMAQGMAEGNRDLLAEAVKQFEQVNLARPEDIVTANNLALLLGTVFGQPERGLTLLDNALKGKSRDMMPTEVIDSYVRILRAMERLDEGMQLVDKALEKNPDQALLLYQKGMILISNGQADTAREALTKALSLGLPNIDEADAQRALDSLK